MRAIGKEYILIYKGLVLLVMTIPVHLGVSSSPDSSDIQVPSILPLL